MIELESVLVSGLALVQDTAGKPPVLGGSQSSDGGTPVESAPGGNTTAPGPTNQPVNQSSFLFFAMVLFVGFMLISMMMQGRKEKRRKAELLGGLARLDKVQTLAGIIGTIAEINGEEVVLRVDDATNSRVRVARSSIQTVLKKGRGPSAEGEEASESAA